MEKQEKIKMENTQEQVAKTNNPGEGVTETQTQALKGIAVVLKQTGIPVVVVVGNKENAKKYIDEETSTPSEQYGYVDINIVIRGTN